MNKYEFKVGDYVKIKSFAELTKLRPAQSVGSCEWKRFCGKTLKITDLFGVKGDDLNNFAFSTDVPDDSISDSISWYWDEIILTLTDKLRLLDDESNS